jgi:RNA polymerase sigma-70 factor (ECF subfamily)
MRLTSQQDVTQMLQHWGDGSREGLDRLIPIVYGELRRQASRYLRRERLGNTLQTTGLVHETYLRLVDQKQVRWQNRAHFFGIAAQLMRRILVDHVRARKRAKRGGSDLKLPLDEAMGVSKEKEIDLITLDEALTRLAEIDEQQSRIVELRFFSGLGVEETAEVLGISERTVKRDWQVAKLWLRREISRNEGSNN